jgi:hypothetical protein
MITRSGKKKISGQGGDNRGKKTGKGADRPGLPAESSIVSEKTFTSPGNRRYRIITTSERDSYDEPDPVTEKKRH